VREIPGDLRIAAADPLLDPWCGMDHSIKHNGKLLAHTLSRHAIEDLRALVVKCNGYRGFVVLIDPNLGLFQPVPGQQRLLYTR